MRNLVEEVLVTEQAWTKAFLDSDLQKLESLMHADYLQIQSDGSVLTKTEVLATFDSGERYWEFAKSDEHHVQIFGHTAIVTGRWRAKGINHGVDFEYAARFVAVYVDEGEGWEIVSDQSTDISTST